MVDESTYKSEYSICFNQYVICTILNEMRMSHWVNRFYIIDAVTAVMLLDFRSEACDYMGHKEVNGGLEIQFRIYPEGNRCYKINIDFENKRLFCNDKTYPFGNLDELLRDIK